MKKQNLKSFANQAKTSLVQGKARGNRERTAERNVFRQLVILQHELSLERYSPLSCSSNPLGPVRVPPFVPVPWALATSDGAMIKTDKAELMQEDKSHLAQTPTA